MSAWETLNNTDSLVLSYVFPSEDGKKEGSEKMESKKKLLVVCPNCGNWTVADTMRHLKNLNEQGNPAALKNYCGEVFLFAEHGVVE